MDDHYGYARTTYSVDNDQLADDTFEEAWASENPWGDARFTPPVSESVMRNTDAYEATKRNATERERRSTTRADDAFGTDASGTGFTEDLSHNALFDVDSAEAFGDSYAGSGRQQARSEFAQQLLSKLHEQSDAVAQFCEVSASEREK